MASLETTASICQVLRRRQTALPDLDDLASAAMAVRRFDPACRTGRGRGGDEDPHRRGRGLYHTPPRGEDKTTQSDLYLRATGPLCPDLRRRDRGRGRAKRSYIGGPHRENPHAGHRGLSHRAGTTTSPKTANQYRCILSVSSAGPCPSGVNRVNTIREGRALPPNGHDERSLKMQYFFPLRSRFQPRLDFLLPFITPYLQSARHTSRTGISTISIPLVMRLCFQLCKVSS